MLILNSVSHDLFQVTIHTDIYIPIVNFIETCIHHVALNLVVNKNKSGG